MISKLKGSMAITLFLGMFIIGITSNSVGASQELASNQTLVIGLAAGDIATIDTIGTVAAQDRPILHHIFGALVRHPVGDALGGFQPDLAAKWGVSPDNLTWTFHLRKGVKWHWGYGEVTSEDVVYSLNRVKNSKVSAFRSNYDNFKEIKAIDKYTVQIITSKPEPFLLTKVANYLGGWIVSKSALEKSGKFDKLTSPSKEESIGTGPWKFLEYLPKDRIVLVRNDDYWGSKPIIEKIIYRYIPDDTAREFALLKGEIAGRKGMYDAKWLKYIKGKGMVIDSVGPPNQYVIYFNLKMKPFDNKKVRQAFAYAIAQKSMVELEGEEISHYAVSPVPEGLAGHIDAGWGEYNKYDPEKAKKLLTEAGYPNGFNVKLFMSVAYWYLDKMIIFQNQLKEVGINLEFQQVDHSDYIKKILQGLNPVVILGFQYPLATSWLRGFFHTSSIVGSPKAAFNFMYYSNPELDRLIELAETTFDENVRLDALAKAQRIIVEDLPAIPVLEDRIPLIRNPWFDLGYEPKSNFLWEFEIGLNSKILKH